MGQTMIVFQLQRTDRQLFAHARRDMSIGFVFQFPPFRSQTDNLLALIRLTLFAADNTLFLHSLKQRSDRVCLQQQPMSNLIHRLIVLLPQH